MNINGFMPKALNEWMPGQARHDSIKGLVFKLSADRVMLIYLILGFLIGFTVPAVSAETFVDRYIERQKHWQDLPPWAAEPPWPDPIEIEKADPVMGDQDPYEIWAYTENFAKRFSNLPIDKVNPEMPPGLEALVFRVQKRRQGKGWRTKSKNYVCSLDMYLDSDLPIRVDEQLGEHLRGWLKLIEYRNSLDRLSPIRQIDSDLINKQETIEFGETTHYQPVKFLDGLLDGLSQWGRGEYRKNALEGLDLMTIDGALFCDMIWPYRDGQKLIISLMGNDPYMKVNKEKREAIAPGLNVRQIEIKLMREGARYDWQPQDMQKGLIALPSDFAEKMLMKVAAVKTMNRCIVMEEHIAKNRYKKMTDKTKQHIKQGCDGLRKDGHLYDAYYRFYGLLASDTRSTPVDLIYKK